MRGHDRGMPDRSWTRPQGGRTVKRMTPVWFITGASRGFGLEIARQALAQGDRVVATARNPQPLADALGEDDRLLTTTLDVTDAESAQAAAAAAVERFGRIDVVVNNAGRGLVGAVEEASDAEARAVFDTNVFGLLTVTRAVLPVLRRQRAGRIIDISSVGGFVASPGWGLYNATKFAVEALSDSMGLELGPLGIRVTVVEPGLFRTDFLDGSSLHAAQRRIEDYDATAGGTRTWAGDTNHAQPGDPAKAAAASLTIAAADDPPTRLQLGADCVARVEAKLAHVTSELATWRKLSVSTDHDDVVAA
jgi:NAD(P)-dependent dehydrogenase (short-subunit alcohol dehydrogenase family)